jgi:hypothetical protein
VDFEQPERLLWGMQTSGDQRKWLYLDLHIIQQSRPRYQIKTPGPVFFGSGFLIWK